MRAIVGRWVTPLMVIFAATSVVFAATWTMVARFGGTDQFAGRNGPRAAQGPVGRQGAAFQTGAVGAPIRPGPARQAPIGASGATAPAMATASGDVGAAPRQQDGVRQGARVPDEGNDQVDGAPGERSFGDGAGRRRERH
jgi:hypothetical protein